jgi:hypothetical protein
MARKKSRRQVYDTKRSMLVYETENGVAEDSMWFRATRFYVKPNGECFIHYIDNSHDKDAIEITERSKFEILLRNYGCPHSFDEAVANALPRYVHSYYYVDARLHHRVCTEAARLGVSRSEIVNRALAGHFGREDAERDS